MSVEVSVNLKENKLIYFLKNALKQSIFCKLIHKIDLTCPGSRRSKFKVSLCRRGSDIITTDVTGQSAVTLNSLCVGLQKHYYG